MDYISYIRSKVGNEKVIMVVAGAFVQNKAGDLLLQKRKDTDEWGLPGGFMEMGESTPDTARREVFEETGLCLGELQLFRVYSGPEFDKTFVNGDQVSLVQVLYRCREFTGELIRSNSESADNSFFKLKALPEELFQEHISLIEDFQRALK
ncbi:phosphohydrolase [Terribacillus saccharophilus]|uniref:NUDIX hydrolase n=1 Tax=Terribacillus saccharophilus TaxID=361277 RepID=UPI000BA56F2C|nr:NUDIX domain-containing protein [Terribacillus saccharophilus]PAF21683.1 phosphohydrolase [Terribacillus saccharophilus]